MNKHPDLQLSEPRDPSGKLYDFHYIRTVNGIPTWVGHFNDQRCSCCSTAPVPCDVAPLSTDEIELLYQQLISTGRAMFRGVEFSMK
jgi:hypothetical protein